jgi:hypothetical protein
MRPPAFVSLLPLAGLVSATPLPRQTNSTTSSYGVLKPETYATIQALFNASQIPGGILAVSSPDGDEIIPMGIKTKSGVPVDENVSWVTAYASPLTR